MSGDGANTADVKSTPAYTALTKKFGAEVGLANLLKIAQDAAGQVKAVKEPKADAKKSPTTLYQWFQSNWDAISPILDNLSLPDDEEEDEGDDDDDE
jgi:hypothetical protein